ncbi:uncharacterized protein [Argopecten irradians]|uniref:uncharacterized protein n=1 Tax=Argopecten irradians TaxID=31199 RepID=UPI00371BC166
MAAGSYYKKCSIQFCKRCKFKAARAQGLICKFVLDQRFDLEEKNHALECLEDYLDDGGLVHGYDNLRNDDVILYSLNKHKRWMLLDYINELVEREEVKDDEFRLVLHERSAAPPSKRHVILEPELLEELKEHTLAYHDSKCTNHHIYPSGYFSTVTDLSLKCYTHTVNHSSGPQQKLQKFQHESVIRGDVHPVAVPEIRYEITDPDFVIGPCKCDSKKGFIHRCTTKVKRFGWKKKGNHNKSWSRWYYQGLDHTEHQRYRNGYYDNNYHLTDTLWPRAHSNEGIFQSDSPKDENQPRNFTFKDFLCSGNSNSLKKPKKDFKKKKRIPRQKDVEKIPYTTIKRPVPKKQYDIDTRKSEIKKEVSIVNVGTKQTLKTKPKRNDIHYDIKPLGKDFNKSFCSCMVNKDSIEDIRTQPKGLQVHIANCVPQQLRLCVTGETTQAYLLFWQKSEWSKWSTEAEYWLKILLKPFTKGQLLLPIFLREELAGKPGHVYKVLELVDIAQRVVNLATAKKGLSVKPRLESVKFEPGQLTARVSRARVDIQTVQEAYKTLSGGNQHILYEDEKQMLETTLNSDVGLLESYELLPSSLTQTMDFGFCKSCLDNFDPPLLNGCVLLPCLHYYCVPCWRKYIWERIQNRCSSVSCQDDTCDEVVDEVMIQTLLPCQLYNHWLHSRAEGAVAQSPQWHHCPKQSCDLVAKVTKVGLSYGNVPVACGCDRVWCWSCEAEAHWPVTCTQYSTYRESLSDLSQSCRNKEILSQGPDTDIHTIDQYNSYLLHSTVQYKVILCNEHRSAWTTQLHNIKSSLWKKVILKRERFGSRRNLKKMNRYAKNSSSLEKLES